MLADENTIPETPESENAEPETDAVQGEERAISRLAKPEEPDAPESAEAPVPDAAVSEAQPPAPQLSDPINRDKEATGEMRSVKAEPVETLEDDPPVIHDVISYEATVAPDTKSDHGTMTPQKTPSASEIVANAHKKAADIVEDRVNMSGSVRQAKGARYEAIQETKSTNAAFEKAAEEVGSVVDKLEGKMGVMDFLLDKELDAALGVDAPAKSTTSLPTPTQSTTQTSAPQTTSTDHAPEWKRKASELYEQKKQQEQDIIDRRRAQTESNVQQRTAHEDQVKAGREALEARLREERAASEARMKSEREIADANRRAEQDRLRAERAAMDARLKEERAAADAERRASKKLGRSD